MGAHRDGDARHHCQHHQRELPRHEEEHQKREHHLPTTSMRTISGSTFLVGAHSQWEHIHSGSTACTTFRKSMTRLVVAALWITAVSLESRFVRSPACQMGVQRHVQEFVEESTPLRGRGTQSKRREGYGLSAPDRRTPRPDCHGMSHTTGTHVWWGRRW